MKAAEQQGCASDVKAQLRSLLTAGTRGSFAAQVLARELHA